MRLLLELLFHTIITFFRCCGPGGTKTVVAENLALRQQLIALNRNRKRSPQLTTQVRFVLGFLAQFISMCRLTKISIILQPATILKFHRALVERK
ncbi:MAG: hypothetical protein P8Y42_20190, partial [Exilibacterium sp.]